MKIIPTTTFIQLLRIEKLKKKNNTKKKNIMNTNTKKIKNLTLISLRVKLRRRKKFIKYVNKYVNWQKKKKN